jgi:hypothetical protein
MDNPNRIPVGKPPSVPANWGSKPDAREFDRAAAELKSKQIDLERQRKQPTNMATAASRIVESLRAKAANNPMAEAEKVMDACRDGERLCDYAGRIELPGVRMRYECTRKTRTCNHGREEYIKACRAELEGMGLRGEKADACFMAPGFILDELSIEFRQFAWSEGFRKNPLMLAMGKSGPGKTYCAYAVAAHFKVALGREQVVIANAVKLFRGYQTTEKALDLAIQADLLILDDLTREVKHDANSANVYLVIDQRIEANLPTIITCNKNWDDLKGFYDDERLSDRLKMFRKVVTTLESKRKEAE